MFILFRQACYGSYWTKTGRPNNLKTIGQKIFEHTTENAKKKTDERIIIYLILGS